MPTTNADDDALLTMAFSLRANPGAYALLIGAGVSAPSGILTAWGVLRDLITRLAALSGQTPEDPIEWYATQYGEPARYETVLEKLAPKPVERQRLLREYFEPSEDDVDAGRKAPTVAHRSIARLVRAGAVRVILTLNFDRLIEQAIRAEGIEPTIVASPSDIQGLAPLHTLDCCVVHLHGDYLNPDSMLNTSTELESYDPRTIDLLHRVLGDYGLVIAGWSSTYDPALRTAITEQYPSRFTLAWIDPAPQTEVAQDLLTLKTGLLVPADADSAFGKLADAVESLNTRNARHPLTVAVAAETAKRELSGRWVAIRLHDTLATEFDRLHRLEAFHLPNYQSDAPYGGYQVLAEQVEEASKVACALVTTLAYWGNETTDKWWLDELGRFAQQARGGGDTRLLQLRFIAGSALMYSAGVAAVAAKRYELVAGLTSMKHDHPYGPDPKQLVDTLAAESVYSNRADRSRIHTLLRSVLPDAISLGPQPLDEAWQLFEIVRLATMLCAHPQFDARAGRLRQRDEALQKAQEAFVAAEGSNDVDAHDDAQAARANAWQESGRALGSLADLVYADRPHVLTANHHADRHWVCPLAERLSRDLDIEGDDHALVRAGVASDAPALSVAVRAVSVALGRSGRELAYGRVQNTVGVIPDEIWLDTSKTPAELAS